jgi:septum formation protein
MQADTPALVLASASAPRRSLLESAGLRFATRPADIDEAEVKNAARTAGHGPSAAALSLARLKAATVAAPDAMVIGCDQILTCDGAWFDKPATMEEARSHLLALRGRSHTLHTATVCLRDGEAVWEHVERPLLAMRSFTMPFLDRYLAAEGEALLGSVGAYRLEGLGVQLFDSVDGSHSAILGLPLLPLLGFLRECGIIAT